MSLSIDSAYYGREQTLIKHEMLRKYLGPAARIIGSFADCFVYVDCCSGPWKAATADLSDTSFSIACQELREAASFLKSRGRHVEFRCLFLEQDSIAFNKLEEFCGSVNDLEVRAVPGDFTAKTPEILSFIERKPNSFTFFFIDPTGWTPLSISAITPLLERRSSEVLINFMTSHIKRFLEASDFEVKFGPDYMRKVVGLRGQALDDSAAYSFADEIRHFFPHTCTSVVLNPERNTTHFHLIYGTRHLKGLQKFKEAEKSCFEVMQAIRLDARSRRRGSDTRQDSLFGDLSPEKDRYLQSLRQHYLKQAFDEVAARVDTRRLEFDEVWRLAAQFPLVWQSDVRDWLATRILPKSSTQKDPAHARGSKTPMNSA